MANLIRYESELAIAAPVWHELRFSWLRMPAGQRRDAIVRFVQDVAGQLPILAYDAQAARVHAELRAQREQLGQTLAFVDGQIAAIAIAHGATLVTRNTRDFAGLTGLRMVNWFELQDCLTGRHLRRALHWRALEATLQAISPRLAMRMLVNLSCLFLGWWADYLPVHTTSLSTAYSLHGPPNFSQL